MLTTHRTKNHILSALGESDLRAITPLLESVDLPFRKSLEQRGHQSGWVYFPDTGVASVVTNSHSARGVEVGMIGFEGFVGIGIAMHAARSAHDTFMQVPGAGWRMEAHQFSNALDESVTLRISMLQAANKFFTQVARTAVSNARGTIEERLARRLLMVHDRVVGDEVQLTHELLSTMLGVRRPGVTLALNHLEGRGLIACRRGAIVVVDRQGLELKSKGAYGLAEQESFAAVR